MCDIIDVALADFVAVAERVIALKAMSVVQPQRTSASGIRAPSATGWSRRMRTAEAAPILGISEHALRRRIRANMCADGSAHFDGVFAERLGRRYLVRLSRRWLTDPAVVDADGALNEALAPAAGQHE